MKKPYYITTAIAYTSGTPHIGNVYEIILADAIARFKRLEGYDVHFQTGTDEHGQKIEQKAKAAGVSPQAFVDQVAGEIRRIFDSVNTSYDYFIRTTDKDHELQIQKMFKKLYEQGDIYKSFYEGKYCVSCESFYTESQIVDNKCPDCGDPLETAKEETYFLKLSKYQDQLLKHIEEHPEFIQPESRKNEMINNFLKEPLHDLAVSRTSFKWGIPVDFDDDHVVYVWLDALSNYITGLGYDVDGNHKDLYQKFWPADVHLIGKDILRFHTIYWPIMLMALGQPLPKQVFGHPWLLVGEGKMSKSKGNSLYTDDLVAQFGVDAIRYYVLRETPFANDGKITPDIIVERYNGELVNTLSNLVNRTISMINKYQDGKVLLPGEKTELDLDLIETVLSTKGIVVEYMNHLRVSDAIQAILSTLRRTNKYIDETEPWILGKETGNKRLESVLYNLLESIRHAAVLLQAFMPATAENIFKQINQSNTSLESLNTFDGSLEVVLGKPEPIFQRLDVEKTLTEFQTRVTPPEVTKPVYKPEITIDDFAKLDLVVGEVIKCEQHPDADKLLVSHIDLGNDVRQIVSGIKDWVSPEEFIGKKVVVVANLKPVKLRGVMSEGMILAGKLGKSLEVLTISLEKGAKVS